MTGVCPAIPGIFGMADIAWPDELEEAAAAGDEV